MFAHKATDGAAETNPPRQPRNLQMFKSITTLLFTPLKPAQAPQRSVAGKLMDRAESCAGQDPQRAAELRRAALAYLGVVR